MTTTALAARTGLARTALVRQKIINHVVLVVDASPSMGSHVASVRQQIRDLVSDLAEQSRMMDQETRLTIYAFSTEIKVLAFDTDVLRLTDIHEKYDLLGGYTALLDATAIGLDDLATTSALYGDHGFLVYVITDGGENDSRRNDSAQVRARMDNLPENWTVGALVPDVRGRNYAREAMGVPGDNVAIWDTHSREGFQQVGSVIRSATAGYMTSRSTGVRGTRSLFSTGADAVNDATVKAAASAGDLQPLAAGAFAILQNGPDRVEMRDFVTERGLIYVQGRCFYEFFKTEHIQPQKQIAIREKRTGKVFTDPTHGSPAVRAMLNLPGDFTVKVRPDANDKYEIFVQSTAPNRMVIPGKRVLILK